MALWPIAAAGIAELTYSNTSYAEGIPEFPAEGNVRPSDVEMGAWAILVCILYAIYRYSGQASRVTRPQHACLKEETLEFRRVQVANGSSHVQPAVAMPRRAKGARTADSPAKPKTWDPGADPKNEAPMLQKQFRLHVSEHNMEDMLHTLEKLDGMPDKVPVTIYCTAIKQLAKQGEAVSAHRWLQRAVEVGHIPYKAIFHAVINAYAKHRNMKSTLRVVEIMKLAGVSLDTIHYNTIIEAWAQIGDADNAQLWMERMAAANVQPSSVSFGFVFVACAKAGQMDALEAWFLSSQKHGIHCGWECLSPVAHILVEKGELDSAAKWIIRIIDSGADPGTYLFMSLLRCSLTDGNTDRVVSVLEHMRAASMAPDGFRFSQLVIGAITVGRLAQAQEWADECVAHKKDLSEEAQVSMIGADLKVPVCAHIVEKLESAAQAEKLAEARGKIGKENMVFAHGGVGAPKDVKDQLMQAQGWESKAILKACTAHRQTGVIRDFVPLRFGHILCKETFKHFGRDVHVAHSENPRGFAKGQRVEFSLRVGLSEHRLSAYDIKALRPSD